jgi:hypothetical protein
MTLSPNQMQETGAVLRVAGMPVGVPAQIAAATACSAAGGGLMCQRWITLGIAAAVAWYGYHRRDTIGWVLVASAAASVLYSAAFWESDTTALPPTDATAGSITGAPLPSNIKGVQ